MRRINFFGKLRIYSICINSLLKSLNRVMTVRKLQRFLSQPFTVAQVFTGIEGTLVDLKDTIRSFKAIMNGEADDLPEGAFYMVGDLEAARAKGEKIMADLEKSS
jgi:F-type H+-transporting ATPase subunit beta